MQSGNKFAPSVNLRVYHTLVEGPLPVTGFKCTLSDRSDKEILCQISEEKSWLKFEVWGLQVWRPAAAYQIAHLKRLLETDILSRNVALFIREDVTIFDYTVCSIKQVDMYFFLRNRHTLHEMGWVYRSRGPEIKSSLGPSKWNV